MDSRNINLYNKGSKNAFYFKLWIKWYRNWSIHSFGDGFCWFIADLNFLKVSHVIRRIFQIFCLDLLISCWFLRMEIILLYYSSLRLVSYMIHFNKCYLFLRVFWLCKIWAVFQIRKTQKNYIATGQYNLCRFYTEYHFIPF